MIQTFPANPVNLKRLFLLVFLTIYLPGCQIVDRVYDQFQKDVQTHMFPEDIADESPPLATDTYICDSARILVIYRNEGTGVAVVEYEGRASFLERVPDMEDKLFRNNQTTLRLIDSDTAEIAREQVPILTNCKQQFIQVNKEFVN